MQGLPCWSIACGATGRAGSRVCWLVARHNVVEVHNERNPIFPFMSRPEPIPPNVDDGLSYVTKVGADVAIINDGDADRLGIGDEHGNFIDQLRVYGMMGYYLLELRGERGPIVKTIRPLRC